MASCCAPLTCCCCFPPKPPTVLTKTLTHKHQKQTMAKNGHNLQHPRTLYYLYCYIPPHYTSVIHTYCLLLFPPLNRYCLQPKPSTDDGDDGYNLQHPRAVFLCGSRPQRCSKHARWKRPGCGPAAHGVADGAGRYDKACVVSGGLFALCFLF